MEPMSQELNSCNSSARKQDSMAVDAALTKDENDADRDVTEEKKDPSAAAVSDEVVEQKKKKKRSAHSVPYFSIFRFVLMECNSRIEYAKNVLCLYVLFDWNKSENIF